MPEPASTNGHRTAPVDDATLPFSWDTVNLLHTLIRQVTFTATTEPDELVATAQRVAQARRELDAYTQRLAAATITPSEARSPQES